MFRKTKMDENGHKFEKLYAMFKTSRTRFKEDMDTETGLRHPVTHTGQRHPAFVQAILMEDPSITSCSPEATT
jgi:hypothetical protein